MTDNALIIRENSAMSAYQEREEVRELGDRLMAMHPAASEVGATAMRAVAQLSLLLNANPLPGVNEVHVWKDDKGRVCMSLGVNYWRRKGNEWGGYLYEVRPRPMNNKELADYNIPAGTSAAICKGCRAEDMIRFKQLGFTTIEIWDMCGRTGIATQGANEYAKKGRPSVWTPMKRAETDMLRQLFPAEFGRVDRQMMNDHAPAVTIVDAPDDDSIDDDEEPGPRYTLADANRDFGLGGHPSQNVRPAVIIPDGYTAPEVEPDEPEEVECDEVTEEAEYLPSRVYIDGVPVHPALHTLYDAYLAAHNNNAPNNVAHLKNWEARRDREAKANGNAQPAQQAAQDDLFEPEPVKFVDPA